MATKEDKLDYKREYKDLYIPQKKPCTIEVPDMNFVAVDGKGDPNGDEYQSAMSILYAISFTIKMSKKGSHQLEGYFEYVVPPLEGLWGCGPGEVFDLNERDRWTWTSMIRLPEFVTEEVFAWAKGEVARKKPEADISKARFMTYSEGLCVQAMHTGPYADEPATMELIHRHMESEGFIEAVPPARRHHEIYLSDPRKTRPERLRTVLRIPVDRKKIN